MVKNFFNPTPVLSSLAEQYHNKPTFSGVYHNVITPSGYILPFQLTLTRREYHNFAVKFYLVSYKTGQEVQITEMNKLKGQCTLVPTAIHTPECHAVLWCGGITPTNATVAAMLRSGTYYLRINVANDNGTTDYYTDLFSCVPDVDLIMLKFRHSTPIQTATNYIPFWDKDINTNEFSTWFEVYLHGEIMKNPFEMEEEVTARDGFEFVEKKVSYKKYNFTAICTEYLVDCLRTMWHCDDITIYNRGEEYDVDNTNIQPDWKESNHYATTTITFRTDTIIQTNGTIAEAARDFNEDFNDDFLI